MARPNKKNREAMMEKAKIVFMQDGDNMVSTIDCTPAELLGAVKTLVSTFADASGIDYNEILEDLKEEDVQ